MFEFVHLVMCTCLECQSSLSVHAPMSTQDDLDEPLPPELSSFNDGRGVNFILTFTALPLKPKSGKKKPWKNAKRPSLTKTFYLNEHKATLVDLVEECLAAIKSTKPNGLKYKIVAGKLCSDTFDLFYTIPRSSTYKNVTLRHARSRG